MPLSIRSNSQLDFDGLEWEVRGGRSEDGMGDVRFEPGVGRRRGCGVQGLRGQPGWRFGRLGRRPPALASGLDPIKLQLNPGKEVWDLPAPPASLHALTGAVRGVGSQQVRVLRAFFSGTEL